MNVLFLVLMAVSSVAYAQELEDALRSAIIARKKFVTALENIPQKPIVGDSCRNHWDRQTQRVKACREFCAAHNSLIPRMLDERVYGEKDNDGKAVIKKINLYKQYTGELNAPLFEAHKPLIQKLCVEIAHCGDGERCLAKDVFFWSQNTLATALLGSFDTVLSDEEHHRVIYEWLLDAGADVRYNRCTIEGMGITMSIVPKKISTLQAPVQKNNVPLVELLAQRGGAKLVNEECMDRIQGHPCKKPITPLFYTLYDSFHYNSDHIKRVYDIMHILLRNGADVNARNAITQSQFLPEFVGTLNRPMSTKIHVQALGMLRALLESHPDIDQLVEAHSVARKTVSGGWKPVEEMIGGMMKSPRLPWRMWDFAKHDIQPRMNTDSWKIVARCIDDALETQHQPKRTKHEHEEQ